MTEVQVVKDGVIGKLVLNSPATLNALTHADIKALITGLARHEADPEVRAIVICSTSEKAFCAGGDMKQIRQFILQERYENIQQFFIDEYALNLAISRCSKPYIAFMHGITMGGGLGVSVHGSARIVTEKSMLAMPESRIGFFPDVGASFFLPRLKQRAGYWLGLTATSITGHEAVAVGLATHCINSEALHTLPARLNESLGTLDSSSTDAAHGVVNDVLTGLTIELDNSEAMKDTLSSRSAWFSDDDLPAIHQRLKNAVEQNNEDAAHLLHLMQGGSPYSASITIQLFRDTSGKNLEDCLKLELELGNLAVRHPDCAEGIRSVLVDKDRNPTWQSI